jgi:hypothetical protein
VNWYYVSDREQRGPVAQADFDRLIQSGTVNGSTLVWQEGMADWKPYGELQAPLPPATEGLDRPGVVCSVCGQIFPMTETIRLDNQPVCASCKPVAMQKLREGVTNNAAEQIRKDHIKHEASVKSIGILYFLAAIFLILAGGVSLFADQGSGLLVGLVLLGFGAAQIWVGIGLRGLKSWARIPTALFSGVGLLGFPFGTLINGYILYLVLSKKGKTVFADDYKRVIEQTPHIKYKTSIVVWIFLGLLLLLIFLGLLSVLWGSHR